MDSAFSTAIPDSSLAAIGQLSENSRLGFASRNPALHRGIGWSKSTLALGLPQWSGKTASDHVVAANNVSKQYGLTTPCGSSASQVMGAVEGNFGQFGNYSRWGGLESVTFSPPSGMGPGSTIPISVSVFGFTQNLSVNVQSMNSQSMTFTTNPGHLLYPASITFAASPASPGSINFNINLGGTVASPTQFYFGGSSFEDAQWNHFLGKVGGFCKVGG